MKKKLYFAAIAALALVSCNEKMVEPTVNEDLVEFEVSVPDAATKLTGAPAGEVSISNLQVFVFEKTTGELEAYGSQNANNIRLTCLPGLKDIVALVNAPSLSGIADLAELQTKTSFLSDNVKGRLVMSGIVERNLSATDNAVTVEVARLPAKVTLMSVTNAMDLEVNRNKEFVITKVYLTNVSGECKYFSDMTPELWYHKQGYEPTNTQAFLYDEPGVTVAHGKVYSTSHYFYCYPNPTAKDANGGEWGARKTRLVVEATLGGETCYYPITLDKIAKNSSYAITLTVTRPGSSSPDVPVSTSEATFSVSIKEWASGGTINERI